MDQGMAMSAWKRVAGWLPQSWQRSLKRTHYARQIRRGSFHANEPEVAHVRGLLQPGDWVIDVGANVGHYVALFSKLVGPTGRVLAYEPMPESFALLADNVLSLPIQNVTLLNLAASDSCREAKMLLPLWPNGLGNFYEARLTDATVGQTVLCGPVDFFDLPHRVALVKIDVEDHELEVLRGMTRLLERDHPHLIVEANSPRVVEFLAEFGYRYDRFPGSPNYVFAWEKDQSEPAHGQLLSKQSAA